MNIKVYPSQLFGSVTVPASKSAAHRAVICAALADGESVILNVGTNDDIIATINSIKSLGANCICSYEKLVVSGIVATELPTEIDCNESGSTLRFMTPIVAALGINASFYGKGRLPERPMTPLLNLLSNHGVTVTKNGDEIFAISGKLQSGIFELPGDISSQYITGLLFALTLLDGNSEIILTTHLESAGYIDMTIDMMSKFGVHVETKENGYSIEGNQNYKPTDISVEGDFSSGAFWLSAAALGHSITIKGLDNRSLQADKEILSVLEKFGAEINTTNDCIEITSSNISGIAIDASPIPDSVPILAVVASNAVGTTRVYNAGRLKIKESDRLQSTAEGLANIGADVTITDDGLIINGVPALTGGTIDSFADHRIAMALSIAALNANAPVTIMGAECVNKSYPNFYNDLVSLGGKIDVIDLG